MGGDQAEWANVAITGIKSSHGTEASREEVRDIKGSTDVAYPELDTEKVRKLEDALSVYS